MIVNVSIDNSIIKQVIEMLIANNSLKQFTLKGFLILFLKKKFKQVKFIFICFNKIKDLNCEIIDDNLIELLINTLKQHKSLEKFICSN